MRQIFQNRYISSYQFSNSAEQSAFVKGVSGARILSIEESDGQNYICYVGRNSLTGEVESVLTFQSDNTETELNVLLWEDRIIFDSGSMVHFVTADLALQATLKLTTPLVGFYVIAGDRLVILEEAFMRIADKDGQILKSETFDLISKIAFEKNSLVLSTDSGERTVDLY